MGASHNRPPSPPPHTSTPEPPPVGEETSDTVHRETQRRRNSMDVPPLMELRLVLLGRSGSGRRAAGNTILGREEFGTPSSPSALTQRSVRTEGNVCGRRLVLMDTPDWFYPGLSLEEMDTEPHILSRLSAPGPHAFLLVIPVETSKEEDRGLLERMEDMFGEGCWGHTVILFTHDDSLKEQSIEEFLQAGSQDLQQLVEKCGSRYHVLNIKDMTHGPQVTELLEKVEEMVAGNRESFYCSQTYQEAETLVREMEGKIQKEREERKQREEREMRERLDKELEESLKMEELIQEHKRTTEWERQMKEENERAIKRKNESNDREERNRQQIEKFLEKYKETARDKAERTLKNIVLPKLPRTIVISPKNSEFSRQMEEKNRELEEKNRELEEKNRHLEEKNRQLEEKNRQLEEKNRQLEEKDRDRELEEKDRDEGEE